MLQIMGGFIDMNVGVFWETSVGFLETVAVVLQLSQSIAKIMLIWMSKVG